MLVKEDIEVVITSRNQKWYKEQGYLDIKNGDVLTISSDKISRYSKLKVRYICDYCGAEIISPALTYFHKKEGRDCCQKCAHLKSKESYKEKTGYNCTFENPEAMKKIKAKILDKYGVEFYCLSDDFKEKTKNYLDKHGIINAFQLKENQEKQKNTVMEKYGVCNVFQNNEIKEKIKERNIKKYGAPSHMQNKEFYKNFARKIAQKRLAEEIPSSAEQRRICELFKGELNYLFDYYWVDIYFSDKDIYCEYDGSGHFIPVTRSFLTQEQFDQRQKIRYDFLKKKGLKMFRIINTKSPKIKLSDEELLKIKNFSYEFLRGEKSEDNNWIIFDLDNMLIKTKKSNYSLNDFLNEIIILEQIK